MAGDQPIHVQNSDKGDAIGNLILQLNQNDWSTTVQPAKDTGTMVLPDAMPKGAADPTLPSVVVVDKGGHKTHVLQMHDGKVEDVLTVTNSTGKLKGKNHESLTPSQEWFVHDKRLDPVWYPPKDIGGKPVAPYKVTHHNPIGLAFIRLGDKNHPDGTSFGMHGTNMPQQLGKFVSHGCVRHDNADIMKIYPLVQPGTVVYTVDHFAGSKVRFSDFQPHLLTKK